MRTIICALGAFVATLFRSRLNIATSAHPSISAQPSAYGLAQETVFSGPGSRASGRGGKMLW